MIPLMRYVEQSKSQRRKAESWVSVAGGRGNAQLMFNGYKVLVWENGESSANGWW